MVPELGRDDFLLDETQKLLALRQGYARSRDVARITATNDLQHVNTSTLRLEPSIPVLTKRKTNFILSPSR
jgi:hypothetical protein